MNKDAAKRQADSRIGMEFFNKRNERAIIIDYENSANVTIRFDDGYTYKTTFGNIVKGAFKNPNGAKMTNSMLKNDRVGQLNINKFGTTMKIVEYNNSNDIVVEFQDDYKCRVHTNYSAFNNGWTYNPYDKTVCDIGYLGVGKYNSMSIIYGVRIWSVWKDMMERCYNKTSHSVQWYDDCSVDERWHNFQNFAEWYVKNYYKVDNQRMHIDKDILHKGNRVYSEDNCIIVPERINYVVTHSVKTKRSMLPCGVTYKTKTKYSAAHSITNDNGDKIKVHLGSFNSPDDAFYAYKKAKEQYIKEIADKYKDKIPQKVYEALYAYNVEITD